MNTLVDMISGMEVKEDDEDFLNAVDYMFKGLEQRKPNCFAVKQYKKYKLKDRYIAAHIQDGGGCGIEADSVQGGKCLPNLSGTGGQLQTDSFFSFSPAQSQQNHRYIPPI